MGLAVPGRQAVLLAAVWLAATAAHAAELLFPQPDAAQPPRLLQVTLELPLQTIIREPAGADISHEAKLVLADGTGLPLTVARRGKSRQDHCRFPPLWLDFKKKHTENTVFAGQNKLKLVTHCKRSFDGRGYLAAEMLAYRLLNLLSDYSFRVRALQITYADSDNGKQGQHWAFLIEHKSSLAERLQAQAENLPKVDITGLDAAYSTRVALHQYLIGNTDFSFIRGPEGDHCCHNVVPLRGPSGRVYPVPYDFDASGLVNPPYAAPVPSLGISKVTQRLYRGYCRHNPELADAVAEFLQRRGQIEQLISQFSELPDLKRERVQKYAARFFAVLASEKQLARKVTGKCR